MLKKKTNEVVVHGPVHGVAEWEQPQVPIVDDPDAVRARLDTGYRESAEFRAEHGIPANPDKLDETLAYHAPRRLPSRWVNIKEPPFRVPAFRPAWDDRTFWQAAGGTAADAEDYHDFWVACVCGDVAGAEFWLLVAGLVSLKFSDTLYF